MVKIFHFRPLRGGESYGFNVAVEHVDERQELIVGLRTKNGRILSPAMKIGSTWVPTVYMDPETAGEIYESVMGLEGAPELAEKDVAISPLIISAKQVKLYAADPGWDKGVQTDDED